MIKLVALMHRDEHRIKHQDEYPSNCFEYPTLLYTTEYRTKPAHTCKGRPLVFPDRRSQPLVEHMGHEWNRRSGVGPGRGGKECGPHKLLQRRRAMANARVCVSSVEYTRAMPRARANRRGGSGVAQGPVRCGRRRPAGALAHCIRVMLFESCYPSHAIRVILSESYYPSHAIRVMHSESYYPSHAFRVMLSESCTLSHAIRVMLSESYYPSHALLSHAFRVSVGRSGHTQRQRARHVVWTDHGRA
jgi:hypothetical protein